MAWGAGFIFGSLELWRKMFALEERPWLAADFAILIFRGIAFACAALALRGLALRQPKGRGAALAVASLALCLTLPAAWYSWRAAHGDLAPSHGLLAFSNRAEAGSALVMSLCLTAAQLALVVYLAVSRGARSYYSAPASAGSPRE